jgi:hypothetical protein
MISMHFLHGVVIQPNLELKTWPKQLLGSLQLVNGLSGLPERRTLQHPLLIGYLFTLPHILGQKDFAIAKISWVVFSGILYSLIFLRTTYDQYFGRSDLLIKERGLIK